MDMSTRDVKNINADYEFWLSFEYDKWRLLGFSDKISARFGWLEKGQYTKYVTVDAHQARFLLGVQPDIADQFFLNDNHIGD